MWYFGLILHTILKMGQPYKEKEYEQVVGKKQLGVYSWNFFYCLEHYLFYSFNANFR